ncbi:DUF3365 domain-containing protein [bacterium]|nr:DUF3365 domain-containing protein [bacterium]
MAPSQFTSHTREQLRVFFIVIGVVWTLVIVLVTVIVQGMNNQTVNDLLLSQARGSFNKDLVYRRWAAVHGGVYVPVDSTTPPNPYLEKIPKHDLFLQDGTRLTLMNPAYMTRQVHTLGEEQYGEKGHITSLNPLRPENKPDPWEAVVLERMERENISEVHEISDVNGEPHMRYMHAMFTEDACLKCHAGQGYNLGDMRGGISVSIPISRMRPLLETRSRLAYGSFSFLWLLGLTGLFSSHRAIRKRMIELEDTHLDLSRNESLLREVQEAAMIGHFEIDLERQAWRSSPSLDRLLGIDYSATSTWRTLREAFRFIHPDDRKTVHREVLDHFLAGHETLNRVVRIVRRSDGAVRWIRGIGTLKLQDEGQPGMMVGTIQDINAEETARLDHDRLRSKLEHNQRLESIGRLAGGVAHDFNNMLGVILGNIELTRDSKLLDDELDEQLAEAQQAARQSAELTTQLLAFSRLQHSQPVRVSADQHIESSLRILRRMVGASTVLSWQPGAPGGNLLLDPAQFDQILMNLVLNARDAMEERGTITISTRIGLLPSTLHDPDRPDTTSSQYVCIAVEDEGAGMDKETQSHVFEPFFTTKLLGHGTGLGLATVYGIVKQSLGFITLKSEQGKGSQFDIYFPILEDEESQPQLDPEHAYEMAVKDQTILIVEDEEMVARVTRRVLEKGGYSVCVAHHADEALALLQLENCRPSLMITDILMPGLNGVQLAEQIQRKLPNLPILYISGHDRKILDSKQVEHFLPKPFTSAALLNKVTGILSTR